MIVALTADIYSSLPRPGDAAYSREYRELFDLQFQLDPLSDSLGHLQSFQDFTFLLSHIMRDAPSDSTTRLSTGYSP